jgi:hypothetical protein
MKRALIFIGIILVAGGGLFAKRHRAATVKNHLPPVTLTDPAAVPFVVKASNFSDYVDLWGDPWAKTADTGSGYTSLVFGKEPPPASFETFQPKLDNQVEPVVTVLDRELAYSFFQLGGFKLNLNLKPAYPNPDAILPTRIDPGLSGSFSF